MRRDIVLQAIALGDNDIADDGAYVPLCKNQQVCFLDRHQAPNQVGSNDLPAVEFTVPEIYLHIKLFVFQLLTGYFHTSC